MRQCITSKLGGGWEGGAEGISQRGVELMEDTPVDLLHIIQVKSLLRFAVSQMHPALPISVPEYAAFSVTQGWDWGLSPGHHQHWRLAGCLIERSQHCLQEGLCRAQGAL